MNIKSDVCSAGQEEQARDRLTGLMKQEPFCAAVEELLGQDAQGAKEGAYALVYFDITRFKAINDLFGMETGDRLLARIGQVLLRTVEGKGFACRIHSDCFAFLLHAQGKDLEASVEWVLGAVSGFDLPFEICCNAGIYITGDEQLNAEGLIDRAVLAQSTVKGSYTTKYAYYTQKLRERMLDEQEITGMMVAALEEKQFVVYYQPQYNHSTGMLVGVEALVRWLHPTRGLIAPGQFIPIFERNGFISQVDLYVFEQVCQFLKRCREEKLHIVPVSVNLSRNDIFQPDLISKLEALRTAYGLSVKDLRLEITETAVEGSSQHISDFIARLHELGYMVEMDDFGSGYSSLNVLKDVDFDMVKLDMAFLSGDMTSGRGGTIVSSVVRMAKWLGLPVIAEGVETVAQADFMRSIGCDYIQGYLYAKPMPEEDYRKLLAGSSVGALVPQMDLIETMDAGKFWSPESQETLIFSNYVGGAAIFEYRDGKAEILRVNQKYLRELGMNLSEKDLIATDPLTMLDESEAVIYRDMLDRAIQTGEEQECETWWRIHSECCGDETLCIRTSVQMIGKSDAGCMFYAMIRNITAEKRRIGEIQDSERRFRMASEQVNLYYWEYTVATKEMRPCFRCMRDLGLPALVTNYPEPAIEMGIFPPEVADMYRDWHRQIAEGVPQLEAVIPLTVGRVPFLVRYTTEFDETGRPVKAYGSAALVQE